MALDGLLRARAAVVQGIVNGIDDEVWNPETDPALAQNYSALAIDMRGAQQDRAAEPDRPGAGAGPAAVRRGLAAVEPEGARPAARRRCPDLVAQGGQLALLGAGDRSLEAGFRRTPPRGRRSVGCVFGYDEKLAHLIQAGADFIVVPSRFEPCGLTQLCALRYGAAPIVSRVGGLADTVIDANEAATGGRRGDRRAVLPAAVDALAIRARPRAAKSTAIPR